MKEMDLLENRLRSCQPRRPAAKVKQRLFTAPTCLLPRAGWLLGSLAPAAACAALTIFIFKSENPGQLLSHEPVAAMILSNHTYAAYASDGFQGTQNRLSSVTFDWTNHSDFPSSMAPFSRRKLN